MDLSWMAWTRPTALFFACIAAAIFGMTVWQLLSPSLERVGLIGLATTRGDRFFLSLLGCAYIQLAWLAFGYTGFIVPALLCGVFAIVALRWL